MTNKNTISKENKDLYYRKYLLATQILFEVNMELLYKTENKSIEELKSLTQFSKNNLLEIKNFLNTAFSEIENQINNIDKDLDNLKEKEPSVTKKEMSDKIFELIKEIDILFGK